MLILDLDDTIFQTKSMDPQIFNSAISVIKEYYDSINTEFRKKEIISDLWSYPIDVVFLKYNTPSAIVSEFYSQIKSIDYSKLNIKPFRDYNVIKYSSHKKILVTTGLKELQEGKIKALGIENDFQSIFIDDPREKPRQYKMDIFHQILTNTRIVPEKIWVIGDNPESEIKAGKKLGMRTIQRMSGNKSSSKYSDFEIESFEELKEIIY